MVRKLIRTLTIGVTLALIVLPLCAFTIKGEANFNYSLKGTASVSIKSAESEADFRVKLIKWIDGGNMVSGDSDMLQLDSLTKTDTGYNVSITFRRIDKIRAQSEFELKNFKDYAAEGSSTREYIEKLNNGNISCSMAVAYDGELGKVTIPRSSVLKVEPHGISGEKVPLQTLFNSSAADKKTDILTFKVLDIGEVEKITVTLPGKIKFYGGESVKIVDENTLELEPKSVSASVLKSKTIIVDGVEIIEPTVEIKDIGTFIGYVVLDRGMSPLTKGLLIAAGVVIAGLLIFWVIYIRHIGKRVLENGGEKFEK